MIWISSLADYKEPTYNKDEYKFPDWAIGLGWCIAATSLAAIPAFAVVAIVKAKGDNYVEVPTAPTALVAKA